MQVMAKSCTKWTQTVRAAATNSDVASHNFVKPCMQAECLLGVQRLHVRVRLLGENDCVHGWTIICTADKHDPFALGNQVVN